MKQVVFSIAGLFVAAVGAVGGYLGWIDRQEMNVYQLGDQVDDFSLTDIYGLRVSLSDYEDALGYIIIFTCSTCPYSVLYEERIIRLADMYTEAGFPMLVLNPNNPDLKPGDDVAALTQRADSLEFNFPYLIDDQRIFERFGAEKMPQVFLLDRNKTLCYKGAIDDNVLNSSGVKEKYLELALTSLQKEETPELQETRVTGCTIKAR